MKTIDLSILEVKDVQAIKGEADLLKRLRHKNIVSFVEAVLQSTPSTETLYLIMEYCKGGDLEHYLAAESKRGRKIPDSFVLVWLRQLSEALKVHVLSAVLHFSRRSARRSKITGCR